MTSDPERPVDAPLNLIDAPRLTALAAALDTLLNGKGTPPAERKVGYCLMMFEYRDGGRVRYVSNTQRAGVIELLRDQLARLEAEDAAAPPTKQ